MEFILSRQLNEAVQVWDAQNTFNVSDQPFSIINPEEHDHMAEAFGSQSRWHLSTP